MAFSPSRFSLRQLLASLGVELVDLPAKCPIIRPQIVLTDPEADRPKLPPQVWQERPWQRARVSAHLQACARSPLGIVRDDRVQVQALRERLDRLP
jgi:hypothetical protein